MIAHTGCTSVDVIVKNSVVVDSVTLPAYRITYAPHFSETTPACCGRVVASISGCGLAGPAPLPRPPRPETLVFIRFRAARSGKQ